MPSARFTISVAMAHTADHHAKEAKAAYEARGRQCHFVGQGTVWLDVLGVYVKLASQHALACAVLFHVPLSQAVTAYVVRYP